jgi:hypothetical protein
MPEPMQLPLPMIYPDHVEYRYLGLWLRGSLKSYNDLLQSLINFYYNPTRFFL